MSSAGEHSDTSLSGLVALHRQLICAADADVQADVTALLDSFMLAFRHADERTLDLASLRQELNKAIAAMQCFDLLSQRLAHVAASQQALADLLAVSPSPNHGAIASLQERLASSSCCDAERVIIQAASAQRESVE
ncbi:hypothetical protein [Spongiibacter tropicus]|uniref:hypothetical protein n=1 Tax=Spongiibacter tropicus TaxID=454602 RepID=UPI003A9A47CD